MTSRTKTTPFREPNWENSLEQSCQIQSLAGSTDTRVNLKQQTFIRDAALVRMGSLRPLDRTQPVHLVGRTDETRTAQNRHIAGIPDAAVAARIAAIRYIRSILDWLNSQSAGHSRLFACPACTYAESPRLCSAKIRLSASFRQVR